MSDATKGLILVTALFLLGLGSGLGVGWKLWHPAPPVAEVFAPAVKNPDGSVTLERRPEAPADAERDIPTPAIPRGATVERKVEVIVQPSAPAIGGPAVAQITPAPGRQQADFTPKEPCPPVRVDLALVRLADNSHRVIASSPDGKVVGGVDIPMGPPAPVAKDLKWAVGVAWNPSDRTFGAWGERDVAFLRVGADVIQQRAPVMAGGGITWGAMVKVGIRF